MGKPFLSTGWPAINYYMGSGFPRGGVTDLAGVFCRDTRLMFLVELLRQMAEHNNPKPADGYQEAGLVLFTANIEGASHFHPIDHQFEFDNWSIQVLPVEAGSFNRNRLVETLEDFKDRGIDVQGVILDNFNELAFNDAGDCGGQLNTLERIEGIREHYHKLRELAQSYSLALIILRAMYYGSLELPDPPDDAFSLSDFENYPLFDPMRRLSRDVDNVLAVCPDKPDPPSQLRVRFEKSGYTQLSREIFKHSEVRLEIDENQHWWESEEIELF